MKILELISGSGLLIYVLDPFATMPVLIEIVALSSQPSCILHDSIPGPRYLGLMIPEMCT